MTCQLAPTDGAPTNCQGTGNLNACQLCPNSPTYWRNQPAPPPPPPTPAIWVDLDGWTDDRTPHDDADPYAADRMRCSICRIPTTWISPKGKRCHPSCATMYLRRTTTPASPPAQT
jgi:hypothetical protein